MWIPHTIPKSTFNLFEPSSRSYAIATESLSTDENVFCKSDDFGWDNHTPISLKHRCLDVIADDFARYDPTTLLERITSMNTVYFVETLNTSLPIPLVIDVPDGEYWRRRFYDTWPNFARKPWDTLETDSYKTFYLTKYVSEVIENIVPSYMDEDELATLLGACSPYVTAIHCKQLCVSSGSLLHKLRVLEESKKNKTVMPPADPVHVDLELVLNHLKNVQHVSLVYGPKTLTMDVGYTTDLYKFNIEDMDTLGRGLESSRYITNLAVTNSDLDSTKLSRLSPYLVECRCLEEIDFSYCKLRSMGAKSIALYAKTAQKLKLLNLRGNDIGPEGVELLAAVMIKRRKTSCPAIELNLNMNNIGDVGAKYLAAVLASGVRPFTNLRVRNCNITEIGGINIVRSLEHDRGLRAMEIDNNPLTLDVAIAFHAMLKTNFNITYLSTQNCNFPETMSIFFNTVAYYNRFDKRSEFEYMDITDLYDDVEDEYILQEENVSQELESEIEKESDY
ncbi:Leucine-rich repeat,Leucine-rich repeat domain, L domain-like [Cinara cedri]|uniref:Leucine-rich repeat,Leucine-rich repeat domain, L domain-like n=1 Tax=Cinara cedri TaxID=506608 RepID=A0A5E4NPC8_9HEMI|nr:Leucine-rich repeat,Leucine-rich repeat domain, L domain-like [Cinara cedri]